MTASFPPEHIHHGHHGEVIPPRAAKAEADGAQPEAADAEEQLRQRVIAEVQEQAAIERFQAERPELWLQTQRVSKIMGIQEHCDDRCFPEGACFLHTTAPNYSSFCVKQVMEIDLDTCQVTVEIYGDGELQEGIVLLPLETVSWFGFPKNAIPAHVDFLGFRSLAAAHEAAGKMQPPPTAQMEKPKENA